MEVLGLARLHDKTYLLKKYIYPAIELGLVEATHPESPKHPHQKYRLTEKGRALLAQG